MAITQFGQSIALLVDSDKTKSAQGGQLAKTWQLFSGAKSAHYGHNDMA
jgi:hypothetical protein